MALGTPMSEADVRRWFQDNGVGAIADDEAAYIAQNYADPDEDPQAVLQSSLGGYTQRALSGGQRSQGGYSTDQNDPAQGQAPARYDSNSSGQLGPYGPDATLYRSDPGGTPNPYGLPRMPPPVASFLSAPQATGNWFQSNAPQSHPPLQSAAYAPIPAQPQPRAMTASSMDSGPSVSGTLPVEPQPSFQPDPGSQGPGARVDVNADAIRKLNQTLNGYQQRYDAYRQALQPQSDFYYR